MNKIFTKIATLSVGLALAVGVGVAVGSKAPAKAEAVARTLVFDFEDSTAHRTSGSNSYTGHGETALVYTQHSSNITLDYADSVSNTDMSGSYRVLGRIAANTTNSPTIQIGPIDLSSTAQSITGISYEAKGNGALGWTGSYSTNGTSWTQFESHTGGTSKTTYNSSTLNLTSNLNTFYVKVAISVGTSTKSSRDGTIDNITISYDDGQSAVEATSWTVGQISGLYPGRSAQATVTPNPVSSVLPTLVYSSEDESVFTVDENTGVVTAVGFGSALLYATKSGDPSKSYSNTVSVVNYPSYSGVTLERYYVMSSVNNDVTYELTDLNTSSKKGTTTAVETSFSKSFLLKAVGGKYTNTVAFVADNGSFIKARVPDSSTDIAYETGDEPSELASWVVQYDNEKHEYTITNSAVYGTNSARQLLFNTQNDANAIANYSSSNYTKKVSLTEVTNPLADFTIESEKTLFVGTSDSIAVTYTPSNPTDSKTLTWVSSDTDVVTVDNGAITAVAIGEATITASRTIGEVVVSRTCVVSVIDSVANHKGTEADPYTVEEAYYIAKGVITKDYENEDVIKTGAYVKGIITNTYRRTTSELTFWIGDKASQVSAATKGFEVFKVATVYGEDLEDRYETNADVAAEFVVGATVLASGNIALYNSTAEFSAGCAVNYSSYIEALTFARGFNTSLESVCDDVYGNTDPDDLDTAWKAQDTAYGSLETIEKAHILEASPDEDGNDIEQMVAKYDYIVGKYNTSKTDPYNDFLGRIDAGKITLKGESINLITTISENTTVTMIIVITSIIGVTAIGGYFLFKKKER